MNKISFNYEGRELAVDIIYRKRKNISLKVSPKENIQIIAPHKVSSDLLKKVLQDNSKWILSKLNKFKHFDDTIIKRDYEDDEIYYYMGKQYKLKILKDMNLQNKNNKNYNYI